jgi:Fe-S oxidoreductase
MSIKSLVFFVVLVAALAFFAKNVIKIIKYLKLARPENRLNDWTKRINNIIEIVMGQSKLLREPLAGTLHFLIFWGFTILLTCIIETIGEGLIPHFSFSFLGFFYPVLVFMQEVMGTLVTGAVLFSIIRRLFFAPKRLKVDTAHQKEAIAILSAIFTIMVTMFFTFAGKIAADPANLNSGRIISYHLTSVFPNAETTIMVGEICWWLHILAVFAFLNYLPYSKHFHIISSIPNVFLTRTEAGAILKPINFDEEGLEKFGAADVEDFSWKTILDGYSCTECGRCTASCPANITGKILSPKEIMMKIRERSQEKFPAMLNKDGAALEGIKTTLIGNYISEEALWSCTTCMACMQECPVMIEHVNPIVDMRRSLVLMESKFPEEIQVTFRNLENNFSPWAFGQSERMDWAEGLDVKTMANNKDVEYLYWVGCTGAFDMRYKKVSRAMVNILNKAGVSFAVLGEEEKCNGDVARRLGNEYLAQTMVKENVSTLTNYGVKKIITSCPHCFNTFKNEYPQFGGNFKVIHHSVFINDLIKSGKIKFDKNIIGKVAFHDSCYLGRYNGVYDEPRKVLSSINGVELVETERNHDKGFCCGAGGGRMFMEETVGTKVNVERTDELLRTEARTIAAACPFCITMVSDGLKFREQEENVLVKDIAEIVEESMEKGN